MAVSLASKSFTPSETAPTVKPEWFSIGSQSLEPQVEGEWPDYSCADNRFEFRMQRIHDEIQLFLQNHGGNRDAQPAQVELARNGRLRNDPGRHLIPMWRQFLRWQFDYSRPPIIELFIVHIDRNNIPVEWLPATAKMNKRFQERGRQME